MPASKPNFYVVDTSSLIEAKRWYGHVPNFWTFLKDLITEGRFVIPEAVKTEIERGHDFLNKWVNETNENKKFIIPIDNEQQYIKKINDDFPNYINPDIFEADPYVVALAKKKQIYFSKETIDLDLEVYVVSEESKFDQDKINKGAKPKIPNLCEKYGIIHIKTYMILELENKDI